MTSSETLLSLADRLEAAPADHSDESITLRRAIDSEIHDLLPEPKVIQPPSYCSSLDAAMSLVPEPNKPWGVYHFSGACMAFVETAIGKAATPALALCAAALRAKAAQ